jgi:hypothetical protein
VHRGEQRVHAGRQRLPGEQVRRPVEVGPVRQYELDLVPGLELGQIFQAVARGLSGTRGLQVHHDADPRIHRVHAHRAARLEGDGQATITKLAQQGDASGLRERFATGHTDVPHPETGHSLHDLVHFECACRR